MKVGRLRCFTTNLPLATGRYEMSHGRTHEAIAMTIVEITAADGTRGYGEVCTMGATYVEGFAGAVQATVRELLPVVLATDALEPAVLNNRMDAAVRGHLPGKAIIDDAMWDLRGKLLGQPVYALLGGLSQPTYTVFHPITIATPEEMAAEASARLAAGYRAWQLKLGDDPRTDVERFLAVHEVIAQTAELVTSDANRGWKVADAIRFAIAIGDRDTYIEQPCEDLLDLAQVRSRGHHPVIADESICTTRDLFRCMATQAADAINLKSARVGGLTKAARIRDLAQDLGLKVIIDEPMGGEIAIAGIAHLAASCEPYSFLAASHVTESHVNREEQPWITSDHLRVTNGLASAPTGPGLGVAVDADKLGAPAFDTASE
jgi:L-alanine-DL-glutamate epimerase-like enolase superfamily enzyme